MTNSDIAFFTLGSDQELKQVREGANEFFGWVIRNGESISGGEQLPLEVYLQAWAESGNAIIECGGDYAMFLRIALVTANALPNEPFYTHAVVAPGILSEPQDGYYPILDPDWWLRISFNHSHAIQVTHP